MRELGFQLNHSEMNDDSERGGSCPFMIMELIMLSFMIFDAFVMLVTLRLISRIDLAREWTSMLIGIAVLRI